MEVVALSDNYKEILEKVGNVIKKGGIVAAPTDTVYGFVGNATDKKVIADLYTLKARPKEKAFPVFVRDITMARYFAYVSDVKAKFLSAVWPGAITVVFYHKEKLPKNITAKKDTIAMRMPDHPFVSALLAYMNIPLVQSSANLSDSAPAKNVGEIIASFEGQKQKPDLIVDGGICTGKPSLIIDFSGQEPRMVRGGLMAKEDFDMLLKKISG